MKEDDIAVLDGGRRVVDYGRWTFGALAAGILQPAEKGRGQGAEDLPVFVAVGGAWQPRALAGGAAHDVVGAGDLVEMLLPGVFGQPGYRGRCGC